ncbi:MAG: YbaN family protein [Cohaesibacter sp.]|nr:YbaN family protein [Cohaesibacter sp.]
MKKLERGIFLLLGMSMVAIGLIGVILPILPSTIFFLAAAFFFARSSPQLEAWLLEHPLFGPPILAWRDYQAIPRRAKYLAFTGMLIGMISFTYFAQPGPILFICVGVFFVACAYYVGTRPDGPQEEDLLD